MKILLVDDDPLVATQITALLMAHQYVVDWAKNGQMALSMSQQIEYDLLLLDIMLPDIDGVEVCRQVRYSAGVATRTQPSSNQSIPILLLTAKDRSGDRVAGLTAGADDYLTKPYHSAELLARIKALLRRGRLPVQMDLCWEALRLDFKMAEVTYRGEPLHLTPKEYRLLELFLRHPQRIFSRSVLLDRVWSIDECPSEDAVTTQIKGLRQKLKAAGLTVDPIETLYGLGYRLKLPADDEPRSSISSSRVREATPVEYRNEPAQRRFQDERTAAQAKVLEIVAQTWQAYQFQLGVSIERLEHLLAQMETGLVEEKLYSSAMTDAHRLVGSLGSFGHTYGSAIARHIEQVLRQPLPHNPQRLRQLIQNLTQAVQEPPHFADTVCSQPKNLLTQRQSNAPILLVEDDVTLIQQVKSVAATKNLWFEAATNLAIAQQRMQADGAHYRGVVLDLEVADTSDKGLDWLAQLQRQLPVLVLAASGDLNQRVQAARLGATAFLSKPATSTDILRAVNAMLLPPPETLTILAVDDDPQFLAALQTQLASKPFHLRLLADPSQFWQVLEETAPDLVLLDVKMPHFKGTDITQAIRQDSRWCNLPILAISAYQDTDTLRQILTAGVSDYLSKPIDTRTLVAHMERCLQRSQALGSL